MDNDAETKLYHVARSAVREIYDYLDVYLPEDKNRAKYILVFIEKIIMENEDYE